MKKKLRLLMTLLMCAVLLSGCAAAPLTGLFGGLVDKVFDEIPHFDDMVYERPQAALDDIERNLARLEKAFESGASFRAVKRLLDRCYEDYCHFDTMYCLAEIRSCCDMSDGYYAAELAWCLDAYYDLQDLMEEMYYLCGGSPMAERLERDYFWEGFAGEYADASLSIYNEESLALMHRESALLSEYRELTASPGVTLDNGREVDLYGYLAGAGEEEYWEALMAYYRQYNAEMSRIYIELVKTRRELAAVLGYDSYEEMAYADSFERDYTPEQAARYLSDVREHIVPMGGEVEEAFRFMEHYELFDVSLSENKAGKSFQTYLSDYNAPYVFVNPYGDDSDVLSFAHEFGHFVDAYVNYNASESIDVAELFSQAMEYLMLDYAGGALPEERLENLRRLKWLDTLELYAQQASFADFERAVYAADPTELDADFLNELSLQVAVDYGYYDGYSEDYYALSWIDIVHFFEQPFYVVSYPVSNDLALQIWELEQSEPGAGLQKYLEALPRDYDGMIATAEAAGLESPFAPGRVARAAEDLRRNLALSPAQAA